MEISLSLADWGTVLGVLAGLFVLVFAPLLAVLLLAEMQRQWNERHRER